MNKALLIVDVQNDYFPGGCFELYNSVQALENVKKLLKYFRENNLLIYFVQHFSVNDIPFFILNTNGVEIHPEIKPLDSEKIIKKNTPNSFHNTTLKKELDLNNVTDLVICGMMTHICVDTTVKSAKDFGYNVTLVSDACTTRDIEWNGERIPANVVQNVYMSSLDGTFANVLTSKEYFKEI